MKKTIKSTLSLILALGMILSITACEKEEPTNDEPVEENAVPINWYLGIERSSGGIFEYGTEMPEDFFDYWYADIEEDWQRLLTVTLNFDYEYKLEDMPEDFQQAYMEFYEEYDGNFADESGKVVKREKLENLKKSAENIALEKCKKYYTSLDFNSSIEPSFSYPVEWNDETGFEHYSGSVKFEFVYVNISSWSAYHHEMFDEWEWHNKINDLAKISGLKSIKISVSEWYNGVCD
ncbi:MAG: hypothetical protein E7633_07480 [Ruminococcaceae bacterium]|nr:hypothetical protein [Oscillospiraceae bacterium]